MLVIGGIKLPKVVRNYEREDFSLLLSELKNGDRKDLITKVLESTPKIEDEPEKAVIMSEAERLHRRRFSLLDNRKNKYIVDQRNGIIHDRDCDYQKQIPDNAFDMLEDIDNESNVCRTCREKAYIRHAVGSDGKRIGMYHNFFRRVNASHNNIYTLVMENHAKLFMEDPDTIKIKLREDCWKIRLHTRGNVTLYHNNYVVLEDGSRFFVDGFHKQIIGKKNTYYNALSVIYDYSWERHLQGQEEKKRKKLLEEAAKQLETVAIDKDEKNISFIRRISMYLVNLLRKR